MSSPAGSPPAELALTRPRARKSAATRPLAAATTATTALTAVGVILGHLAPRLAASGQPHPTLHGTAGETLSILAGNLRVLAPPFVLTVFGVHRSRLGRRFGDLLIATVLALNTLRVGLALGRLGGRLVPYLPHLPPEWLALSLATACWLEQRSRQTGRRRVAGYALLTLIAAATAAVCETQLTPHPPARPSPPARHADLPVCLSATSGSAGWGAGVVCHRPHGAPAPARSLQGRQVSLPLALLGSARPHGRRLPGLVNHPRSPQGGTTA